MLYKNERIDIRFVHDSENEILIKKMDDQLKLKGYSFKTRKLYKGHMNRFASFINKDISAAGPQEIRSYILFMLDEQQASHAYANQAISALKFIYNELLMKNTIIESIPRLKREKKLPNVMSFQELESK